MSWGKLVMTWIVVGFMFVIATGVNHHFYLLIVEEMRAGQENINQSLAQSNENFHQVYLDQTKQLISMMKTGEAQNKDTRALMQSLETKLTDISIWVSTIQEKVEKQSEKVDK